MTKLPNCFCELRKLASHVYSHLPSSSIPTVCLCDFTNENVFFHFAAFISVFESHGIVAHDYASMLISPVSGSECWSEAATQHNTHNGSSLVHLFIFVVDGRTSHACCFSQKFFSDWLHLPHGFQDSFFLSISSTDFVSREKIVYAQGFSNQQMFSTKDGEMGLNPSHHIHTAPV